MSACGTTASTKLVLQKSKMVPSTATALSAARSMSVRSRSETADEYDLVTKEELLQLASDSR